MSTYRRSACQRGRPAPGVAAECLKLRSLDDSSDAQPAAAARRTASSALPLHLLREAAWAVAGWHSRRPGRTGSRARPIAPSAAAASRRCPAPHGGAEPVRSRAWAASAGVRPVACRRGLADRLPPGDYRLADALACRRRATRFALGWLLGGYRFTRYPAGRRARRPPVPGCMVPAGRGLSLRPGAPRRGHGAGPRPDQHAGQRPGARGAGSGRQALARATGGQLQRRARARRCGRGYPLIEAVGRGSPRAARLVDLRFARAGAPRVTLVGKGVCFDTGGLDLKPSAAHAADEEGHGRRGLRAGARAPAARAGGAGGAAGADSRR